MYLAKVGTIAQYKPRADFASSFFKVGGFEVTQGEGQESVEKAAADAVNSGCQVIVICSSDDSYPEIVPQLTKAIRKGKPDAILVLAGYPTEQLEFYKQAGIDEFISAGANAYELLMRISQKIGVIS